METYYDFKGHSAVWGYPAVNKRGFGERSKFLSSAMEQERQEKNAAEPYSVVLFSLC